MSRPDLRICGALAGTLLATLTLTAPLTATAQPLKSQLDAVQRDLDRELSRRAQLEKTARKAELDLRSLKVQAVGLARKLHQRSTNIGKLETRLADLETEETEKSQRLILRRGELTNTLGALQRIARLPAATLIAMPRPPDDTIRSAILLRSAVPELHKEARRLSGEIADLGALRAKIKTERLILDDAQAELSKERRKLAALTDQKLTLLKSSRSAERSTARAAAELSARAGTLRELLEQLSDRPSVGALLAPDFEPSPGNVPETDRVPAPAAVPTTVPGPAATPTAVKPPPVVLTKPVSRPPSGGLPAPGRIVTDFGDRLPNGLQSRGVSIATRPAASVVAPRPGRVVFAGVFRGYGNLVILELRNKGHALIAGLNKIHAEIGDEVLAGEPLGEMTPSTDDAPTLYFEVRRRGQPINPLPSSAALRTR